jgi:hypothetical protein
VHGKGSLLRTSIAAQGLQSSEGFRLQRMLMKNRFLRRSLEVVRGRFNITGSCAGASFNLNLFPGGREGSSV